MPQWEPGFAASMERAQGPVNDVVGYFKKLRDDERKKRIFNAIQQHFQTPQPPEQPQTLQTQTVSPKMGAETIPQLKKIPQTIPVNTAQRTLTPQPAPQAQDKDWDALLPGFENMTSDQASSLLLGLKEQEQARQQKLQDVQNQRNYEATQPYTLQRGARRITNTAREQNRCRG